MKDFTQTVLSQYANSPTINALIGSANVAIDPQNDIANIYSNLWNVKTAVGQGLNNWGAIVGVGRTLQVTSAYSNTYFGFHEAYNSLTPTVGAQPFGQSPMYGGPTATFTYSLGDADYRTLIMAKAASNVSNMTIPNVNKILKSVFGSSGTVYVVDAGNMVQRYVFMFQPTPVQIAIIQNSGVIPRSAGVRAVAMVYPSGPTFGFHEAGGLPFGSGTFFPTSGIINAS